MKIRDFGNVHDFPKLALPRSLANIGDFKIGVCWMLTDDHGDSGGRQRSYLDKDSGWQKFDPALFDVLKSVPNRPKMKDLKRIERESVIPSAIFYNDLVPADLSERRQFHKRSLAKLEGTELAFVDPDRGLKERPRQEGQTSSPLHAYFDELSDHYNNGRSLLAYQHFARIKRSEFISTKVGQLRKCATESSIWAFESAYAFMLLAARPEHAARVEKVVSAMKARHWTPDLFRAVYQPPVAPSAEPTPAP